MFRVGFRGRSRVGRGVLFRARFKLKVKLWVRFEV
jgi:hypothetical protein